MSAIGKSSNAVLWKNHLILWSLLLVILITFVFMLCPELYRVVHIVDIQALKAINSNRLKWMDTFFLTLTNTSSFLCVIISALTLLGSFIKKSLPLKLKGFQLLLTFLVSYVLIKSLKYLIGRPRPYISYDFLDKLAHAESLSFPSGHTFEAFAFATAVSLVFKDRWIQYSIFLWAVFVGASRMILGVHYLSDVLAGIVFGMLTGYFVHELYRKNIMMPN